jgi:hypothetical protein
VTYLATRDEIELEAAGSRSERQDTVAQLAKDNATTIKQAEVLYALSFVRSGIIACEKSVITLADRLLHHGSTDAGWSVWLDDSSPSDALATAHVMRALHANRFDLSGESWLAKHLSTTMERRQDVSTFPLLVADELRLLPPKEIRAHFMRLWSGLKPGMAMELEAQVELLRGRRRHSVQVPWQLHMLALIARVGPTDDAQLVDACKKLAVVSGHVLAGGYTYDERLSTRTYGIVYDTLTVVESAPAVARLVAPPMA